MARLGQGSVPMTDTENTAGATEGKKRRKPQGPRKPSSFYLFVKDGGDGKIAVAQAFRSPHKMAEYFNTAQANGEQLLVVTPEA